MALIEAEQLSDAIKQALEEYKDSIVDGLKEIVDTIGKNAKSELRRTSPKRSGGGRYSKGWRYKPNTVDRRNSSARILQSGSGYAGLVCNETDYQLTHLLERGHALRQGGRARAFPHIEKIEQKVTQEFLQELEALIKQ